MFTILKHKKEDIYTNEGSIEFAQKKVTDSVNIVIKVAKDYCKNNNTEKYNPILDFAREQKNGFNLLLQKIMEQEALKQEAITKIVTHIESTQAEYQEKTGEILSLETIVDILTAKIKRETNATLNDSEKANPIKEAPTTRLNDLGLPMHPLEVEVADLVERAKNGEKQIFPKYNRASDGNPVAYLKKHYGKYLKAFGADDDYLYQFQLEKIDGAFKENLRSYLIYHGKKKDDKYYKLSINNFVPNISVKADKEAETVSGLGFGNKTFANKVKNLVTTRVEKVT